MPWKFAYPIVVMVMVMAMVEPYRKTQRFPVETPVDVVGELHLTLKRGRELHVLTIRAERKQGSADEAVVNQVSYAEFWSGGSNTSCGRSEFRPAACSVLRDCAPPKSRSDNTRLTVHTVQYSKVPSKGIILGEGADIILSEMGTP
jgi:hypothetical protein